MHVPVAAHRELRQRIRGILRGRLHVPIVRAEHGRCECRVAVAEHLPRFLLHRRSLRVLAERPVSAVIACRAGSGHDVVHVRCTGGGAAPAGPALFTPGPESACVGAKVSEVNLLGAGAAGAEAARANVGNCTFPGVYVDPAYWPSGAVATGRIGRYGVTPQEPLPARAVAISSPLLAARPHLRFLARASLASSVLL